MTHRSIHAFLLDSTEHGKTAKEKLLELARQRNIPLVLTYRNSGAAYKKDIPTSYEFYAIHTGDVPLEALRTLRNKEPLAYIIALSDAQNYDSAHIGRDCANCVMPHLRTHGDYEEFLEKALKHHNHLYSSVQQEDENTRSSRPARRPKTSKSTRSKGRQRKS